MVPTCSVGFEVNPSNLKTNSVFTPAVSYLRKKLWVNYELYTKVIKFDS